MHAGADRLEFAPPATPGLLRAMVLALLAHGLLLIALTWGVHWQRDVQVASYEAELWSAVPTEAAPALVEAAPPEPPPPLPPVPEPLPKPVPKPVPAPPEPKPVPTPKLPEVDIALQQEKQRLKKQQEQKQEEQRQEKLKAEKLKLEKIKQEKAELETAKLNKLKQERLKQEQLKQEQLRQEQLKQEKLKQAQADEAQKAAADKQQAALDAKQREAQRQKNLARIAGLAGATGGPTATGTALKSAGPSPGYAGRIRGRIKPNIVFTEEVHGNPTAEVEVLTAPDGTIISSKLIKSSGLKSWDDAVLKAIDKTEKLPPDTDGRVPDKLLLVFKPLE